MAVRLAAASGALHVCKLNVILSLVLGHCNDAQTGCVCASGFEGIQTLFAAEALIGFFSLSLLINKKSMFLGVDCSEICRSGWWGAGCLERCACADGADCEPKSGECLREAAARSAAASSEEAAAAAVRCANGFYGANCENREC